MPKRIVIDEGKEWALDPRDPEYANKLKKILDDLERDLSTVKPKP